MAKCDSIYLNQISIGNRKPLSIFPNPVRDHLMVDGVETGEVRVFCALGVMHINSELVAGGVNVGNLPQGFYFIRIQTKDWIYTSTFSKVE